MARTQPELSKPELMDLHSILRRACETAERNKRTDDAAKLAQELAAIDAAIKRC